MEQTGVLIDKGYFHNESKKLELRLKELEENIYSVTGERFNIKSPSQLSHILFEKLNLPKSKHKKTHYSTDQMSLIKLAEKKEESVQYVAPLLEYRELFKLKSTYLDPLPKLADEEGRVHTTWQQTATATGRLSSTTRTCRTFQLRKSGKDLLLRWLCYYFSRLFSDRIKDTRRAVRR